MEETNQQSQSPQPVNPTPSTVNPSKSKLIPIILGIAAVAVIAIGAYLFGTKQTQQPVVQDYIQTPTPISSPTLTPLAVPTTDPSITANWKTFKNDKIGYSIKYPPDWKLRNEDQSGELYMLSNAENIIEIQNYTAYNLKAGQTVENYLDSWPVTQSQPTQRIMINNYTAYIQRGIPGGGELSEATYLHIENNNKYLNIAIIEGEYEDVSAILNTIKFGE